MNHHLQAKKHRLMLKLNRALEEHRDLSVRVLCYKIKAINREINNGGQTLKPSKRQRQGPTP